MRPDVFDTRQVHARRGRGWMAWAVTLCLLTLVAAPEVVCAEETKAGKTAREDVRRERTESDRRSPREAVRGGSRPSTSSSRWRDASPREREAIHEKAREKWERASPRERRVFRRGVVGLRRALPELTEIERLVLLRNLFALPKDERRSMRRRLRDIDRLASGERKNFVHELRDMAVGPSQESIRIERNVDRWRELSDTERDNYREQMRRFRSLSAEDRRRLLDEWERSPEARP